MAIIRGHSFCKGSIEEVFKKRTGKKNATYIQEKQKKYILHPSNMEQLFQMA